MRSHSPRRYAERNAVVREIHRKYHEALLLFTLKQCRRFQFDVYTADDIMQIFYLKVTNKSEEVSLGLQEHGIQYLTKMIRNCLIDIKRKQKSQHRLKDHVDATFPRTGRLYHLCFEFYTEQFLERLSDHLSEEDFKIMKLYIEGFTYEEIRKEMKMKVNTVGTRIRRAKIQLSQLADFSKQQPNKLF